MAYQGYHFFVGDLELPYAPSELKVTVGSNNKTVSLIDGGEINILKNPKLTEIQFDVELPRGRQYAFANKLIPSKTYTDYFEKLMKDKTPTQLVITRPNPSLKGSTGIGGTNQDFDSNLWNVSLEGYSLQESAENAYDIVVSLKFKEYIEYGVLIQKIVTKTPTTSTTTTSKPTTNKVTVPVVTKPAPKNDTYTVKKGDCLWNISKKFYGNGAKWKTIYNANKTIIENTAKKYGRKSSSNGHWIYPGTKLTIPASK